MKKLTTNEIYKVLEPGDVEDEREYMYFVCIGFRDNYSILHEFEHWANNNGLGDRLEAVYDLDEEFEDKEELDLQYFKKFNALESVYYIDQTVNHDIAQEPKKKFTIV